MTFTEAEEYLNTPPSRLPEKRREVKVRIIFGTATLPVDADGNLTQNGHWSHLWDAENRLSVVEAIASVPSGAKKKVECSYDYFNRRLQKKVYSWNGTAYVLSSTTKFIYDGWKLIAELDGNNQLLRSYSYGNSFEPVSLTDHTGTAPETYFYCFDGNSNVTALVNATTGLVVAEYEYGAFGELLRATGLMADKNPIRFSSHYFDKETGYYYCRNRYYDPITGRFLSRDPIEEEGGLNLAGYINNDGINLIDRFFRFYNG